MQTYFNTVKERTEKQDVLELQNVAIFKQWLPKYIEKYIKQKKLLDILKHANEAEKLGWNHDENEEIKSL